MLIRIFLTFTLFATTCLAEEAPEFYVETTGQAGWAAPISIEYDRDLDEDDIEKLREQVPRILQIVQELALINNFLLDWNLERPKNKAVRFLFTYEGSDAYNAFFEDDEDSQTTYSTKIVDSNGAESAVTVIALDHILEDEWTPTTSIELMKIFVTTIYGSIQDLLTDQINNVDPDDEILRAYKVYAEFLEKFLFSPYIGNLQRSAHGELLEEYQHASAANGKTVMCSMLLH